ncbi:MAG: hypothetical protein DRP78_04370 [Candidatus Omnitrophota bacterium]|nr:MAG: hypothetical protein DRP78_04370 [Candidatus Omnitrophota bacterium]
MIYDYFQKQAINLTENGNSVIVCAPTGSGKTAIAEHIIKKCISQDKGVIYTTPIKTLSNQKFRDFKKNYTNNIGILTGDISLTPYAKVLIMTTEIFRNTLLENPDRFSNISWVIFDEAHYLDDVERGTVWEEAIIFCPPQIRILALSATIPNVEQIAQWMTKVHKHNIHTVIEKKRPVPLKHKFICTNKIFLNTSQLKKSVYTHLNNFKKIKHSQIPANKVSTLIAHLQKNDELPAIYFAFSRKRCEELALKTANFNFLNNREREKLLNLFKNLLIKFNLEQEPSANKLLPLISKGIAYHHAGLLPSLKEVIEQLFTSRLVKLIFTTETFALGINMPARSVIFDELRKFYGYYYANLRCRDYCQMAGRAGRRGIDKQGFVYSRINPLHLKINDLQKMISGQPEPVKSQFNISYASLLHLYKKWQQHLYDIYPLTLHYFQSTKKTRKNALKYIHAKISLLEKNNYLANNHLTSKGEFAAQTYGYELPITELFSSGKLEKLSSLNLNIVLCALVFEPRKKQLHFKLNANILKIHHAIMPTIETIIKEEKKFKIYPFSKKPYFNLAQAVELWANGEDIAKIKEISSVDEGGVVRYFRMIIQILRQLHKIPFISPQFKQTISNSLDMINHDEVDAEKQLREGL